MNTLIKVLTVLDEHDTTKFSSICVKNNFYNSTKVPYCKDVPCSECIFGYSRNNLNNTIITSTKLGI